MLSRMISGCAAFACAGPVVSGQVELGPSVSSLSWTTLDGLPQNSVASLCQDTDGYLWIGTFGGLARFDGQRFDVLDVSNRSDLPGNRFHQIVTGAEGSLWMRMQGMGLLRYADDRFTRIVSPHPIRRIASDQDGRIWATTLEGVGRVVGDRLEMVRVGGADAIVAASDGAVWVSTGRGELVRIENGGETSLGRDAGLPGEPVTSLLHDDAGLLWVGCDSGAWRSTDAANTRFERVPGVEDSVLAMVQDARGAVWLGGKANLWKSVDGSAVAVGEGGYDSLFADRRGTLWAGSTKGKGLHCILPSPLSDATAAAGLSSVDTWAITAGRGGSVLLLQTRSMVEINGEGIARMEFDRTTRCLLVDSHGVLWIGQDGRLIGVGREGQTLYGEDAGLSGIVYALLEGHDGSLWVGTGKGLYRRDGDRFRRSHAGELGGVRSILEDHGAGVLWVGTTNGLARLEGESLTLLTSKDGFSVGPVRTLHLDEEGVLWAGTYGGGLSRIADGTITRFTRESGLTDNFLACILEDDDGRFWINSNSGPFVVRRADLNRYARGELDKLACVSFSHEENAREANGGNQPSGWRAPDGRMWFPTIEGVTIADPSMLPLDEAPPVVRIESLRIDEKRAFDARFTGLGFSSPKRVQLQYRLVGHDPAWKGSDERRQVRYSYLRPGDYEFQVRGRNGFGPWSSAVGRSFEVAPRFHETAAFVVAIALLGGLGAFGLSVRVIKRSRARTEALELLVRQRESTDRLLKRSQAELSRLTRALLTDQETERKLLSRELHDDVTQRLAALAIQAELAEARLSSNANNASEHLRDIAEKAQQLAGDVQQLSRRLHPVGLRMLGLTEAVRQECEAFTRRSGVEVDLVDDVAADEVSEEVAIAAFRILQESLHNIEKHARAEAVKVSLEKEAGELVITVSDSGCGFEPDTGADVGLGLITMRERAASIGGELSIVSHEGEGTSVRLRAPEGKV